MTFKQRFGHLYSLLPNNKVTIIFIKTTLFNINSQKKEMCKSHIPL